MKLLGTDFTLCEILLMFIILLLLYKIHITQLKKKKKILL